MLEKTVTSILFAPAKLHVEARLVSLSDDMAAEMVRDWWTHESLKPILEPMPIDRNWNWTEFTIEQEGLVLPSRRVALVTSGNNEVQGAMLISTEPCSSKIDRGDKGLFIELLFTAPWNRPALRKDGRELFVGVGLELLRWGVNLSHASGYAGRIRLDGSPDFLGWYERRGLKKLDLPPVIHENVSYTPMELTPAAARVLLEPNLRENRHG